MRILMVHNTYQQRGGEDVSTEQDIELLRSHGHQVHTYFRNNDEIKNYAALQKAYLFFRPTWSWQSYRQTIKILKEFKPEIVHVQNFFPLISPSVFYACKRMKIPVVFNLRNYRLGCANSYFYRENSVCEECIHRSPLCGIYYKCYHKSAIQTAAVTLMQIVHRYFKTWEKKIDVISPVSDFAASKMVYAGLKPNNIIVRKNYLKADPGEGSGRRSGAVFVGRLSPEKGLSTLMNAWEKLPDVPLKIIGTGPEEANIKEKSAKLQSRVTLSGQLPHSEMLAEVKESQFLVMPSVCYETFGRTIVEAYATGTPVIASRLGAIAELVEDGQTGLLFTAGDSDDLAEKVTWAIHHPEDMARMGKHARQVFLDKYEAGSAYQQLMAVYQAARTRTKN